MGVVSIDFPTCPSLGKTASRVFFRNLHHHRWTKNLWLPVFYRLL